MKPPFAALVALFALCAVGCSSSSSTSGPTSDPFATDGRNGEYESRDAACKQFLDALVAAEQRTQCTVSPTPSCPALLDAFEAQEFPGVCVEAYDKGSLDNCAERLGTFTTCADFSQRHCVLVVEPAAPDAACGTSNDAGIDASTDATDASTDDAWTDATDETSDDGAVEAAADETGGD